MKLPRPKKVRGPESEWVTNSRNPVFTRVRDAEAGRQRQATVHARQHLSTRDTDRGKGARGGSAPGFFLLDFHTHTCTHMHTAHTRLCLRALICVQLCVYVSSLCTRVCIYACICVRTPVSVCLSVHMCVHMSVHVCASLVCAWVPVFMCTSVHVCACVLWAA